MIRATTSLATALAAALTAPAATAAEYGSASGFFSLVNTNFVLILGALLFVAILVYKNVPGFIAGALDKRAADIRAELEEARELREEAQSILASAERSQREVQTVVDDIVSAAKSNAETASEEAKATIERLVARRVAAAEERIASAEAAAIKDVRDRAVAVAVAAASEIVASNMSDEMSGRLVDEAISAAKARLH